MLNTRYISFDNNFMLKLRNNASEATKIINTVQ